MSPEGTKQAGVTRGIQSTGGECEGMQVGSPTDDVQALLRQIRKPMACSISARRHHANCGPHWSLRETDMHLVAMQAEVACTGM